MKNGGSEDKSKQRTKKGLVIPVPKRSAFDQLLHNAANTPVPEPEKPSKRGSVRRPKK